MKQNTPKRKDQRNDSTPTSLPKITRTTAKSRKPPPPKVTFWTVVKEGLDDIWHSIKECFKNDDVVKTPEKVMPSTTQNSSPANISTVKPVETPNKQSVDTTNKSSVETQHKTPVSTSNKVSVGTQTDGNPEQEEQDYRYSSIECFLGYNEACDRIVKSLGAETPLKNVDAFLENINKQNPAPSTLSYLMHQETCFKAILFDNQEKLGPFCKEQISQSTWAMIGGGIYYPVVIGGNYPILEQLMGLTYIRQYNYLKRGLYRNVPSEEFELTKEQEKLKNWLLLSAIKFKSATAFHNYMVEFDPDKISAQTMLCMYKENFLPMASCNYQIGYVLTSVYCYKVAMYYLNKLTKNPSRESKNLAEKWYKRCIKSAYKACLFELTNNNFLYNICHADMDSFLELKKWSNNALNNFSQSGGNKISPYAMLGHESLKSFFIHVRKVGQEQFLIKDTLNLFIKASTELKQEIGKIPDKKAPAKSSEDIKDEIDKPERGPKTVDNTNDADEPAKALEEVNNVSNASRDLQTKETQKKSVDIEIEKEHGTVLAM